MLNVYSVPATVARDFQANLERYRKECLLKKGEQLPIAEYDTLFQRTNPTLVKGPGATTKKVKNRCFSD